MVHYRARPARTGTCSSQASQARYAARLLREDATELLLRVAAEEALAARRAKHVVARDPCDALLRVEVLLLRLDGAGLDLAARRPRARAGLVVGDGGESGLERVAGGLQDGVLVSAKDLRGVREDRRGDVAVAGHREALVHVVRLLALLVEAAFPAHLGQEDVLSALLLKRARKRILDDGLIHHR